MTKDTYIYKYYNDNNEEKKDSNSKANCQDKEEAKISETFEVELAEILANNTKIVTNTIPWILKEKISKWKHFKKTQMCFFKEHVFDKIARCLCHQMSQQIIDYIQENNVQIQSSSIKYIHFKFLPGSHIMNGDDIDQEYYFDLFLKLIYSIDETTEHYTVNDNDDVEFYNLVTVDLFIYFHKIFLEDEQMPQIFEDHEQMTSIENFFINFLPKLNDKYENDYKQILLKLRIYNNQILIENQNLANYFNEQLRLFTEPFETDLYIDFY